MRWCTTAPDDIFDVCPEPSGRGIGMSEDRSNRPLVDAALPVKPEVNLHRERLTSSAYSP